MNTRKLYVVAAVVVGCGAEVAPIPSPDAGTTSSSSSSSSSSGTSTPVPDGPTPVPGLNTCTSKGGVCLARGESAPPNRRRAEPKEATCTGSDVCWLLIDETPEGGCKNDKDCNDDPSVSSLRGSCFEGMCFCKAGFHLQKSGKCGATPPECTSAGGTCRQIPASCKEGELGSSSSADMSCGDFIPAVCCYEPTACKAPIDMVCCGPTGGSRAPICVNGWRTCESDTSPQLRGNGCR